MRNLKNAIKTHQAVLEAWYAVSKIHDQGAVGDRALAAGALLLPAVESALALVESALCAVVRAKPCDHARKDQALAALRKYKSTRCPPDLVSLEVILREIFAQFDVTWGKTASELVQAYDCPSIARRLLDEEEA